MADSALATPVTNSTVPPLVANQNTNVEQPVKTDDLISRVSQVKIEAPVASQSENIDEFDYKQIESIKDPIAKEQALKAYKSFQKGFTQKFQELAEQRKIVEKQLQNSSTWTPERIQQLLDDPTFVRAAQAVAQSQNQGQTGSTDDEYSALSEKEKARISELQQKVSLFEKQNILMQMKQQDEQLKGRYSNYDPTKVDSIFQDMAQGKIQATREHLWKVLDYEDAVKRAYELGRKDRESSNNDKVNSMSTIGINATNAADTPAKEKGESNAAYFVRLFNMRKQIKS